MKKLRTVKGVGKHFRKNENIKKNVKVGVRVSFRKNAKVGVRVSVGVWKVIQTNKINKQNKQNKHNKPDQFCVTSMRILFIL